MQSVLVQLRHSIKSCNGAILAFRGRVVQISQKCAFWAIKRGEEINHLNSCFENLMYDQIDILILVANQNDALIIILAFNLVTRPDTLAVWSPGSITTTIRLPEQQFAHLHIGR